MSDQRAKHSRSPGYCEHLPSQCCTASTTARASSCSTRRARRSSSGQSLPALEAVETAAIVISATAGVDATARRVMAHAAQRRLARMIVVNRIDVAVADGAAALAPIRSAFGRECLPLNLPAANGTRVVDCFSSTAAAKPASRRPPRRTGPSSKQVAEVDADAVDRYLDKGGVDASRCTRRSNRRCAKAT